MPDELDEMERRRTEIFDRMMERCDKIISIAEEINERLKRMIERRDDSHSR